MEIRLSIRSRPKYLVVNKVLKIVVSLNYFFKLCSYLAKEHILKDLVLKSGHLDRSGRPGAIWSPIRSPEHLVVNLVLVDAFSFTK